MNRVRGIFCLNSNCKHYFETSCLKIFSDDSIDISEDGKCTSFEPGLCEGYREEAEKRIQDYMTKSGYTWTFEELEHDYRKYYMSDSYCSYTLLDIVEHNEAECKLLFGSHGSID